MGHHLSIFLSASAVSALRVLGAHTRSFAPSPRIVLSVAVLVLAGVLGVVGVGVASSHTSIMLGVNGVLRPMTFWGNTAGDALYVVSMSVGSNDLVQPGTDETVCDGDTIIVCTSKSHTVVVDDQIRTLWTIVSSADAVLANVAPLGSTVSLAADHSFLCGELTPFAPRACNVAVMVDDTTCEVAVCPGQDARATLKASGVSVYPLGRVNVTTSEVGELSINASRVTCGEATETVEIPFSETTTTNSDLLISESQVTTVGVNGVTTWTVWQEKKDEEVLTTAPITEHPTSRFVTQVRSKGTKEVISAALVAAGIDPKATLEEKIEAGGTTSVRYRAKSSTISTRKEIVTIVANMKSAGSTMVAAATVAAAVAGTVPTAYSGEGPHLLVKPLVAARDWRDSEYQCLVLPWDREPQWNPYAESASSGAYGTPQSLPGSKAALAGADWRTSPIAQTNWGIGCIKSRYGTPCSARVHSSAVGWY